MNKSFFLLSAAITSSLGYAQEAPKLQKKQDRPSAEVAIIALGSKPQKRYRRATEREITDIAAESETNETIDSLKGTLVVADLKPFSTPPAQTFFRSPGKDKPERMRISFLNRGSFKQFPAQKPVTLYTRSNSGKLAPYFELPALKANTKTLLILTPSETGSTPWKAAPNKMAISLPTENSTGPQPVYFINSSSQAATISVSESQKIKIPAKSHKKLKLTIPNSKQRPTLRVQGSKDKKIALQESIRPAIDRIKIYAFYDANPRNNAGRTLGVFRASYK